MNTIWNTLCLDVPGYIGNEARRAIAKRSDAAGGVLPEALFHYRSGVPVPDRASPIRISGNARHIFITGIGLRGAELLLESATRIASLFVKDVGGVPVFRFTSGRFGMERSPYPVLHVFRPPVVLDMSHASRERLIAGENDHPDVVAEAGRKLSTRLGNEYLRLCGPDTGEDGAAPAPPDLVSDLRIRRSIGVRVHGGGWATALYVDAMLNATFKGPWQVGKLTSRGYGRIVLARFETWRKAA